MASTNAGSRPCATSSGLPFEHAENPDDQNRGVALFEAMKAETGDAGNLEAWSYVHRDVITRFGRFTGRTTPWAV